MSTDSTYSDADPLITQLSYTKSLPPGHADTLSVTWHIPIDLAINTYTLVATINSSATVTESNQNE